MNHLRASHAAKVEAIASALRRHPVGRPVTLAKRSASHHVPKPSDKRYTDDAIRIGALDAILDIDPERRTCVAEPCVTFSALVDETLRHGLVPMVVPELRTITVGGAVTGCSLESMSFRFGGFHDSCLAYEVVATDGTIVECARDGENALLFEMMHGSFGTLGVLSKVTFRLTPALPFVRMRYETYAHLSDYLDAIQARCERPDIDFIDGILHAPGRFVLSLGSFAPEAPYTNRYDWTQVYFESTSRRTEDYLDLRQYFFRYDRGVTNVHPKSLAGRLLFGRFLDSDRLLRLAAKLHNIRRVRRPDVTIDLFIPVSAVRKFMDWYDRAIGFFPLWCVPYRMSMKYAWLSDGMKHRMTDDLFLDLAIYGLEQPRGRNLYRELEDALSDVGGVKTLISYNYYSPDEFWSIWNRPNYLAARRIADPRGLLRDLYSKTCRAPLGLSDIPMR